MNKLANIDQIRAKNAFSETAQNVRKDKDKKEGDNLSGFPSLIINNGLLATLAFCKDKGAGTQHGRIANAIAYHLNDRKIVIANSGNDLLEELCFSDDADIIRQATTESLFFLNYLKRFHRS